MASSPVSARRLEGKVAVITGGASGIGERTARLFVAHGARVVVADIQDDAGARLCAELGGAASAVYVHCDVCVEADVAAAVDHAVATFGSLDIMFNNAGIGGPLYQGIRECDVADLERVLAVNLVGPFLGAKHAARVMVPARRGGSIVSTASVASALAGIAWHAYTCSKHALVGLTESLAAELGRHGRAMETMGNLRAVGGAMQTEDIANAVLFLASDDARHISGHNLLVDGGMSIAVNPAMSVFKD
ncbi:hypothetical protein QOZ80_4AG0321200 [Eleusine coracana subsp. coracana]|nr:hypothetical protein QOZ80_4AG0321200 [Eleusine coracana subsp. coracana]